MTARNFAFGVKNVFSSIASKVAACIRLPRTTASKLADIFAGSSISIRMKILISLCVVILLMGMVNIVSMLQMLSYSRQYDAIITNITTTNRIAGSIKPDIDNEMYKIVAGKIEFSEGRQYQIINDVNEKVRWMMLNIDSHRSRVKLDVILRTMQTLKERVDIMGENIQHKSTAAENEAVLEEIRFVTSVVDDVVSDYALFEVKRTEGQYELMRESFTRWQALSILLIFGAVGFSVVAAWGLSRSIYTPIKKLHDVTTTITKNDLQVLMTGEHSDEITELGMSFNIMIGKIKELLDSKIKEQEELKKAELRALQAQINPHFLYNTLDTIIWMAQAKKTEQVIMIVSTLSNFFRISLSKGMDWITIGEEVELTKNYLTIQKMRYEDIMDFTIDVEDNIKKYTVLKLILQPLVENALYHGIKNKRQGGNITVRGKRLDQHQVILEVEDTGIGFTPEKLNQLQAELAEESYDLKVESGFGIANVYRRIRLYYGRQFGLTVKSEYNSGTCVTLLIPARKEDENGTK